MMKIVVLEPLGVDQSKLNSMLSVAAGADAEIIYYNTRKEDTVSLIERSRDADAVILSNIKFDADVMENCPKLKYICVAFTGTDHIDTDYCRKHGINVSNCAGYSTSAVADMVFGFAIDLLRNIIPLNERVRHNGTKDGLIGFEMEGLKFGVIGAGAIGTRTANIAKAFGCDVYIYSRTQKNIDGITFTDLNTLMSTCDIISLHIPSNPETKGMISREKINLMKKNAILINTARGPIVDSQALADALNNGAIAGAATDVFECEPPIPEEHPLLNAKNCIATPHVAFASHQAMEKRAVIVCENIREWRNGNILNKIC